MDAYAVIDTNVLVAALLTKNENSPTLKILKYILSGYITPLYHKDILEEYREVLIRPKFKLDEKLVNFVIESIRKNGIEVFPKPSGEILLDNDDLIFYEVALEYQNENAFLVTGNLKHYPECGFIVSPAEIIDLFKSCIN